MRSRVLATSSTLPRQEDVECAARSEHVVHAHAPRAGHSTSSGRGRVDDVARTRDRITLTGVRVRAHHGVYDVEREQGQEFVIDVTVVVDLSAAASGDDLGATVHYGELAEAVVAAVERDPVDLIETVAERVAAVALGYPAVDEVEVTVHKPEAPISVPFTDVAVTIVRGRA